MKLRTEIELMPLGSLIDCSDGILFLGSCFSDNMGGWLKKMCMNVCTNPFGTLYNPASIAQNIDIVSRRQIYEAETCCCDGIIRREEKSGLFVSFDHHGNFASTSADMLCQSINQTHEHVYEVLQRCSHVFITWGTAFVYQLKGVGRVVANCHKFPADYFERRRLTVEDIVSLWIPIIERFPEKHFVFTVSPIRHVRDGLHENQISKSILLLAADQLRARYPKQVDYLPIYEYFMDDLRDYRFYGDDLVHPSSMAIEMVKDLFSDCCLSKRSQAYVAEVGSLQRALEHRPLHPESEEFKVFVQKQIEKVEQLFQLYGQSSILDLKARFVKKLSDCSAL